MNNDIKAALLIVLGIMAFALLVSDTEEEEKPAVKEDATTYAAYAN